MPVSEALERSARDFCAKYACRFDFTTFEAGVEEFTFLRPVSGWIDLYKATFERLYRHALEGVALGAADDGPNAEAMLDDFEYTLMRPYVNQEGKEIKHRPYGGMDRISRLEYLERLTREAPANSVELYAEMYRKGELPVSRMRAEAAGEPARLAGYAEALDRVCQSRSTVWRVLHPFKNDAEKRNSRQMKQEFMEATGGGEALYRETVTASCETPEGLLRVHARLEQSMVRAREDMTRVMKMNDVMRESIRIEELEREPIRDLSPRVDHDILPAREKNIRR